MRMRGLLAAMALGLLAGCTPPSFTMPPGTPAYRDGYAEGCDVGYAVAGSVLYRTIDKAEPPPQGDPQRIGWLAGYDRCKRNYQRMQTVFSSFFGPP